MPCNTNAACADQAAPSLNRTCSCNAGYIGDGYNTCTGLSCNRLFPYCRLTPSDLNACLDQPCAVNASCIDLAPPSLTRNCSCNTGYSGDAINTCSDTNYCSITPCVSTATCVDLPAPSTTRNCTCNTGYVGDGASACSDWNACPSQPCGGNATCSDLPPPSLTRSCACNTGYSGNDPAVQCTGTRIE